MRPCSCSGPFMPPSTCFTQVRGRRGDRYDFPGVLAPAQAGLCLLVFALRLVATKPRVERALHMLAAGALAAGIGWQGYASLRQACATNADTSKAWSGQIDAVAERVSREPERPIVLVTHNSWDYEFLFSAQRFLRARGVTNPLALDVQAVQGGESRIARRLLQELRALQTQGGKGFVGARQLRRAALSPAFAIGFSGAAPTPYVDLGRIR